MRNILPYPLPHTTGALVPGTNTIRDSDDVYTIIHLGYDDSTTHTPHHTPHTIDGLSFVNDRR